MATTPNGLIARENGDEDFLSEKNWQSLLKLVKLYGNLIWGRKTYEAVSKWEGTYLDDLKYAKKIIVTSKKDFTIDKKGWQVVHSPEEAVQTLQKEYDTILLSGGSTNNSSFMKAGLIDEIIINIEPYLLGKGIPLFAQEDFEYRLQLQETNNIGNGILQMKYKVLQ